MPGTGHRRAYDQRMASVASDAVRGEIVRLAHRGMELPEFASNAARVLRRAVPFDGVAIVACDPATALPVAKWAENTITGAAGMRLAEIEIHEPDVNKITELALSGRRAASLSAATRGRLDRSRRYGELMRPLGFGDELRAVCVGVSGMWGVIVLHREHGAPHFAPHDVEVIASLSGEFAEALQRVSVQRDLAAHAGDREPGLLLLDDEHGVEMANDAAAAWLEDLRADGQQLPLVVTAVADRARAIASGESEIAATARVRAASGRWVLVRGSVVVNGTRDRAAVTLEAARTHELATLIVAAHGLTARERRVTELVAQGLSTAAIAARLHVSAFTVQDHLKSVFEKLGVSSRGELVARLFVDHYPIALERA
jgi:DNA-binding CsgD family transcriptional regulator